MRLFQLPTGADDYAIILTPDYLSALVASRQRLQASKGELVHVFNWFREGVLPACCDVMLTHRELLQLLGRWALVAPLQNTHAGFMGLLAAGPWLSSRATPKGGKCQGSKFSFLRPPLQPLSLPRLPMPAFPLDSNHAQIITRGLRQPPA